MKKLLTLLFAAMLTIVVAACSGGDQPEAQDPVTEAAQTNTNTSENSNTSSGNAATEPSGTDANGSTTEPSGTEGNGATTAEPGTTEQAGTEDTQGTAEPVATQEGNAGTSAPADNGGNTPATNNGNDKPAPTTNNTTPAPTTNNTKPAPTTNNTTPAPTTNNTTPAPTTNNTTPAPTTNNTKPAPTTNNTTPAPTTNNTKPAPTTNNTKPATNAKLADPKGKKVIIIGRDHCVTKGGCEDDLIAKELRKAGFRVDFVGEQKATVEKAQGYDLVWFGVTLNEDFVKEGQFLSLTKPQIHSKGTGLMAMGLMKKNYSFEEVKVPRVTTLAFATEKEKSVNLAGSPLKEGFSKDEVVIYKDAADEKSQFKAGSASMEAKCTNLAGAATNPNTPHIYSCAKGTKLVYGSGTTKAPVAYAFAKIGVHEQLTADGWKLLVNLAKYMVAQK